MWPRWDLIFYNLDKKLYTGYPIHKLFKLLLILIGIGLTLSLLGFWFLKEGLSVLLENNIQNVVLELLFFDGNPVISSAMQWFFCFLFLINESCSYVFKSCWEFLWLFFLSTWELYYYIGYFGVSLFFNFFFIFDLISLFEFLEWFSNDGIRNYIIGWYQLFPRGLSDLLIPLGFMDIAYSTTLHNMNAGVGLGEFYFWNLSLMSSIMRINVDNLSIISQINSFFYPILPNWLWSFWSNASLDYGSNVNLGFQLAKVSFLRDLQLKGSNWITVDDFWYIDQWYSLSWGEQIGFKYRRLHSQVDKIFRQLAEISSCYSSVLLTNIGTDVRSYYQKDVPMVANRIADGEVFGFLSALDSISENMKWSWQRLFDRIASRFFDGDLSDLNILLTKLSISGKLFYMSYFLTFLNHAGVQVPELTYNTWSANMLRLYDVITQIKMRLIEHHWNFILWNKYLNSSMGYNDVYMLDPFYRLFRYNLDMHYKKYVAYLPGEFVFFKSFSKELWDDKMSVLGMDGSVFYNYDRLRQLLFFRDDLKAIWTTGPIKLSDVNKFNWNLNTLITSGLLVDVLNYWHFRALRWIVEDPHHRMWSFDSYRKLGFSMSTGLGMENIVLKGQTQTETEDLVDSGLFNTLVAPDQQDAVTDEAKQLIFRLLSDVNWKSRNWTKLQWMINSGLNFQIAEHFFERFLRDINYYVSTLQMLGGTVHPVQLLFRPILDSVSTAYVDCLKEFFDSPLEAFVYGEHPYIAVSRFFQHWSQQCGASIGDLVKYIFFKDFNRNALYYYNEPIFSKERRYWQSVAFGNNLDEWWYFRVIAFLQFIEWANFGDEFWDAFKPHWLYNSLIWDGYDPKSELFKLKLLDSFIKLYISDASHLWEEDFQFFNLLIDIFLDHIPSEEFFIQIVKNPHLADRRLDALISFIISRADPYIILTYLLKSRGLIELGGKPYYAFVDEIMSNSLRIADKLEHWKLKIFRRYGLDDVALFGQLWFGSYLLLKTCLLSINDVIFQADLWKLFVGNWQVSWSEWREHDFLSNWAGLTIATANEITYDAVEKFVGGAHKLARLKQFPRFRVWSNKVFHRNVQKLLLPISAWITELGQNLYMQLLVFVALGLPDTTDLVCVLEKFKFLEWIGAKKIAYFEPLETMAMRFAGSKDMVLRSIFNISKTRLARYVFEDETLTYLQSKWNLWGINSFWSREPRTFVRERIMPIESDFMIVPNWRSFYSTEHLKLLQLIRLHNTEWSNIEDETIWQFHSLLNFALRVSIAGLLVSTEIFSINGAVMWQLLTIMERIKNYTDRERNPGLGYLLNLQEYIQLEMMLRQQSSYGSPLQRAEFNRLRIKFNVSDLEEWEKLPVIEPLMPYSYLERNVSASMFRDLLQSSLRDKYSRLKKWILADTMLTDVLFIVRRGRGYEIAISVLKSLFLNAKGIVKGSFPYYAIGATHRGLGSYYNFKMLPNYLYWLSSGTWDPYVGKLEWVTPMRDKFYSYVIDVIDLCRSLYNKSAAAGVVAKHRGGGKVVTESDVGTVSEFGSELLMFVWEWVAQVLGEAAVSYLKETDIFNRFGKGYFANIRRELSLVAECYWGLRVFLYHSQSLVLDDKFKSKLGDQLVDIRNSNTMINNFSLLSAFRNRIFENLTSNALFEKRFQSRYPYFFLLEGRGFVSFNTRVVEISYREFVNQLILGDICMSQFRFKLCYPLLKTLANEFLPVRWSSGLDNYRLDLVNFGSLMKYEHVDLARKDFLNNNFLIRGFFDSSKEFRLFSWNTKMYDDYLSELKNQSIWMDSIDRSPSSRLLTGPVLVKSGGNVNFWENVFVSVWVVLIDVLGLYDMGLTRYLGYNFEFNFVYNFEDWLPSFVAWDFLLDWLVDVGYTNYAFNFWMIFIGNKLLTFFEEYYGLLIFSDFFKSLFIWELLSIFCSLILWHLMSGFEGV